MKTKVSILFFLLAASIFAQKVSVSIDSTKKKVGAEFKLTLKTEVDKKDKVIFPKDNYIGQFEVINNYKTDTLIKKDKLQITKKYGITQFDSGKYVIPKLIVKINGKPAFTDLLLVEVANVKVDTTKQKLYDIKSIIQTPKPINWWFILQIIATIAAVGAIVYFIVKQNFKAKKETIFIDKRSPIEKANANLEHLENKNLIKTGNLKAYYSELTNIARTYIEEELKIPAMESTTSELMLSLEQIITNKKINLSKNVMQNLSTILQKTDLIKFAKSIPNSNEISTDKAIIQDTVLSINNAIPKDNVAIFDSIERQKQLLEQQLHQKQKRKKQLIIAASIAAVCLVLTTLFLTQGFDYLKDKILGHPTKELAQGDWIFSQYGNPSINLETPKVLKRYQVKVASKSKKENDIQVFNYGSLIDNFFIEVSTQKLNAPTQIPLDQIAEETIRAYEKKGIKDILLKVGDYDLKNGIKGKKASGTMNVPAAIGSGYQKVQYELILFAQYRGLQQIMITCKEDDIYGKQIMQRIEKSIELEQATE